MLEFMAEIDRTLFIFINSQLANPITDFLMPIVTSNTLLRILYGSALLIMLIVGDSRMRWLCLFSGIVLLLADQTSASILKPLIGRMRPCHALTDIHLLVNCGAGKAMPSAHAANAFAQAILFSLAYPRSRIYLLTFATIVALSRIFVGVHYPGDILVGAAVGSFFGVAVWKLFEKIESKLPRVSKKTQV